jgi:hypothetical protein
VLLKRCLSGSISMLRTRVKYKTALEPPIGSKEASVQIRSGFHWIGSIALPHVSQTNMVMTILCLLTRKVE